MTIYNEDFIFRPALECVPSSGSLSSQDNCVVSSSNHSHSHAPPSSTSSSSSQNIVSNARRRSTRHRNYMNRSQLHNAVNLPEGYGK